MNFEKGTLTINQITFEIVSCTLCFSRKTSTNGFPGPKVYGGGIELCLSFNKRAYSLEKLFVDRETGLDGNISYPITSVSNLGRRLSFQNGFIKKYKVCYDESFKGESFIFLSLSVNQIAFLSEKGDISWINKEHVKRKRKRIKKYKSFSI